MKRALIFAGWVIVIAAVWFFAVHDGDRTTGTKQPLRFVSLAWQEQALATNRAIVAEWNAAHPESEVEYVQGTWSSVHDYLITGFETGDVPDVFHYESSIIVDFALRGFLTDLRPMIDGEMQDDILDVAWASVTRPNGEVCGIPFLMESLIGLYNADLLDRAGIAPPTFEKPWSWDDLRRAARGLTADTNGDGGIDRWGVAIGLRNSANIMMNLSVAFGGSFYAKEEGRFHIRVGDHEKALLSTIHHMLYSDRSAAPSGVGQSGPEMMSGFFSGRYAMLIGIGAWSRQQLATNAPPGFRWGVIPPLKAVDQRTGVSTQTLSIPRASVRKNEAMAFIKFMLSRQNMARLAQSDWMLPARKSCLTMPEFTTSKNGWDITTSSARFLSVGPWLGAPGYAEWKSRVANPLFQEYFANRLGLAELASRMEDESNMVLSRYQKE
jgi:multiple sugar transport system substrate-binding protein